MCYTVPHRTEQDCTGQHSTEPSVYKFSYLLLTLTHITIVLFQGNIYLNVCHNSAINCLFCSTYKPESTLWQYISVAMSRGLTSKLHPPFYLRWFRDNNENTRNYAKHESDWHSIDIAVTQHWNSYNTIKASGIILSPGICLPLPNMPIRLPIG